MTLLTVQRANGFEPNRPIAGPTTVRLRPSVEDSAVLDRHARLISSATHRVDCRLGGALLDYREWRRDIAAAAASLPTDFGVPAMQRGDNGLDNRLSDWAETTSRRKRQLGRRQRLEQAARAAAAAAAVRTRCDEATGWVQKYWADAEQEFALWQRRRNKRWLRKGHALAAAGRDRRAQLARLRNAAPAVDTGREDCQDSLLALLWAPERRGRGAVRVLRRRPTLVVLSRRRRERLAAAAAAAAHLKEASRDAVKRRAALQREARPAVDARLGRRTQEVRDQAAEPSVQKRRIQAKEMGAIEQRAVLGTGGFARTESIVITQMAHHRGRLRRTVACLDTRSEKGQGCIARQARPQWKHSVAPKLRGGDGVNANNFRQIGFTPGALEVQAQLTAHRRRLAKIAKRPVSAPPPPTTFALTDAQTTARRRKVEAKGAAARKTLERLNVGELSRRAAELGVEDLTIEAAQDALHPQRALAALVFAGANKDAAANDGEGVQRGQPGGTRRAWRGVVRGNQAANVVVAGEAVPLAADRHAVAAQFHQHTTAVRRARQRGAMKPHSHGWGTVGDAWEGKRNQQKWRHQRIDARIRRERATKVAKEARAKRAQVEKQSVSDEQRARARLGVTPQMHAGMVDADYWGNLSD